MSSPYLEKIRLKRVKVKVAPDLFRPLGRLETPVFSEPVRQSNITWELDEFLFLTGESSLHQTGIKLAISWFVHQCSNYMTIHFLFITQHIIHALS